MSSEQKLRDDAFAVATHPAHVKAARQDLLKNTPNSYKGMLQKAYSKKLSPRQAIKTHCYHCACWNRLDAQQCVVVKCPLWEYRPQPSERGLDAPEDAERGTSDTLDSE